MRTISDLTYEPHRLIVAIALGALALGAISGRVVRHWLLVGWTTFGALIAGIVLFNWLHTVGISGDTRLIMLAGPATAAAWLSGLLVVRAGALRVVGLITLAPTLIVGPVLWVRDTTPPLSASAATRVFEKRFTLSHYRCYRAYNDGSVGLAKLEFQCDPSRPPSYCLHHVCGPRYWFGVDGRGRIGQWMLSAP